MIKTNNISNNSEMVVSLDYLAWVAKKWLEDLEEYKDTTEYDNLYSAFEYYVANMTRFLSESEREYFCGLAGLNTEM